MDYCRYCGSLLPGLGKFCPACGGVVMPKYASFLRRAAAFLIDSALLSLVLSPVSALLFAGGGFFDMFRGIFQGGRFAYYDYEYTGTGILALLLSSFISLVAGFVYYTLMDSSAQQGTLGKMALNIKVTDINGERLTFGRAAGRYFARYITDMANNVFLIGYLIYFLTDKKQALHDIVASTLVLDK